MLKRRTSKSNAGWDASRACMMMFMAITPPVFAGQPLAKAKNSSSCQWLKAKLAIVVVLSLRCEKFRFKSHWYIILSRLIYRPRCQKH
ncbi:hypothetical protein CPB83DRAFT_537604 [Crepidotus variabilis]|uniref:Uncharacterized protein n=1 Tax=Crepidotus variabilis TaxID=179855 RepID=A0A9P6EQU7_9AGAR|nr:hypothetical protein CPB83DRAFT_537604 [Crepidotus variabilis]